MRISARTCTTHSGAPPRCIASTRRVLEIRRRPRHSLMVETLASPELQSLKAQFFQALAHPIRIRILEILVHGDVRVQDLQKALAVDQPIVSQQLARLRASGIVVTRKDGTATVYGVADPEIRELLRVARSILNRR